MQQWIQITAGRGPAECAWAVPRVLKCLAEEAFSAAISVEVLESVPGPFSDTLDSVLIAVDGSNLKTFLAGWLGSILWIGRSPFRPAYKRKNWFIGVSHLALPERVLWSEKELRFDTMRASGPGGQHVNKTETAVRVTHTLTGLTATAREERSQSANRKLALARLGELFSQRQRQGEQRAQHQRWTQHDALERGNPIRIYHGAEFERRQ